MSTWQPGDFLYAMPSGCQGEMVSIRPEIWDHSMCCQEVEWQGSSDSMHWSPDFQFVGCTYCGKDHGAECPRIAMHYLTIINLHGSERPYDVRLAQPSGHAHTPRPPERPRAAS